ncbi:MAG: 50S ribosomal protein L6 [Phycisphaeraceae bacterium JB051]
MSRVGKQPITIPSGVKVNVNGCEVNIEGKNGKLSFTHKPQIAVAVDGDTINVTRDNDSRESKALHGLTRSLVFNMIVGVTEGYEKNLEINGVGWTAQVKGREVHLNVGFADTRIVGIPEGVTVTVEGNKIKVVGPSKQLVGQCAAQIRSHKKPEPYNGKGIKYSDEVILRKEGKALAG